MFHRHKYGKVEKGGYQYCIKCGKAQVAPCAHRWKIISTGSIQGNWGSVVGRMDVLQCQICGDLKNHETSLFDTSCF